MKASKKKSAAPTKKALRAAWMAGAKSGTEIAFDLILRGLEKMRKDLGVKKRKPRKPAQKFNSTAPV